jgi:cation diffusion facilitator CzcD-associated flavoprotein CzcO
LQDKSVAIIGAGSSGIQVVPALVSKVKSLHHYVRGKTWISTQLSEDILEETTQGNATNFNYSADQIQKWKDDPEAYLKYRKSLEFRLQGNYDVTQRDSARHVLARVMYERNMRERLKGKPEIIDQLIPDFPPLCKRLTPGPGYLEALTEPHVTLISQPIVRVDSSGVITSDGVHRSIDAIICATGFETSPGIGFPIYGEDGINLREKYSLRPKTYLGLCTNNFPNFFQSLGPNSFQGAGSLLIMMEQAHKYMAQILKRLAYGNLKTIQPKRKQVNNFTNFCDEYFQQTVYSSECVSWYKTPLVDVSDESKNRMRVTALWPGSSVHALRAFESVRWDDYELDNFHDNEFGWFGNGTVAGEQDVITDITALTWYLDGTNFLDQHSCRKKGDIEAIPK